ncbi:MAG: hypothetical protein JNK75_06720 [Betaproteobacteria bacterium]|nr:hypothetical protein [Betaproteobacteria bacterium]
MGAPQMGANPHRAPRVRVAGGLAGLLAACAALPAAAEDAALAWSAKWSYDRNSGKYGTNAESHDTSATLTLGVDTDHYAFDLVLPYVAQTGPGRRIALAGRRLVVLVEPGRTAMGTGDITLGATRYLLNEETHGFDLDVGGSIKFGTASAGRGLGTGKNDYALQASLGRSFGPLGLSATAGYTFAGKPEGQELRNSAFATVDAHWRITKAWSVGATWGYGAPTSAGATSSRDLTCYLSHRLSKTHRLELSFIDGHSPQSPDRGFGVTYTVDF